MELIIVIGIIGILTSVVLASVRQARVKARISAAQSTMSSLQNIFSACVNDNVNIIAPNITINTQDGDQVIICSSSSDAY